MSLLTPLIWMVTILPFFIIALITSKKGQPKYLMFFVLYFLADCYLQHLSKEYVSLENVGLKFAWVGKILSLILSLIIIYAVSMTERQEMGFTTKTASKSKLGFGICLFLGFLLFDFIFKMMLFPKGGKFDLETFAFQAIMPGLTEELVFRGISLWLLDKAFLPNWTFKGIQFGWGFIIVTVSFGIVHGVVLTKGHEFKIDFITIAYLTIISSLSLGLLRKFSGNLIYPIIGHNTINVMNAIIRIL